MNTTDKPFSLNHESQKNTLKKYKIIIAYDGTDYFGWQVQTSVCPSVAQTMQDAFARVFNKKITLYAASRTDAGVHAIGQAAVFATDLDLNMHTLVRAWSNILTPAIVIRSIEPVVLNYNIHQHVITKTYWYHFFTSRPLPFTARYGWNYRHTVDVEKLQKCLEVFLGTHDFRSFSTGDDRGEDTIRRIDKVSVEFVPEYNAYRIAISGPKFLKYMVRRIVGACIEVASRTNLDVSLLKEVLDKKNPEHLLPNAPAHGLVLYQIEYNDPK